jgi:hypothetical protein
MCLCALRVRLGGIQLEQNALWPEDVDAIEDAKTAFFLRIRQWCESPPQPPSIPPPLLLVVMCRGGALPHPPACSSPLSTLCAPPPPHKLPNAPGQWCRGSWRSARSRTHTRTCLPANPGCSLLDHHKIQSTVTRDFLDVAFEGFVFRLALHYPRQLLLLEVRAGSACMGREGLPVVLPNAFSRVGV